MASAKGPSEKRVLIVEDSEDIQILLTDLLEAEGYLVDHVADGKKALAFLEAGLVRPGVILLDLMMPDMDGYEFRARQREHKLHADIPIVLMTADRDIQPKAEKLQVQAYLKKPFIDIELILKTVGAFFPAG